MYLSDYETYISLSAFVNIHSFEGVSPKHVSPSWPDDHSTLGFNFSELTYGNYFKTWLLFRAHIQSANNIILTIFGATRSLNIVQALATCGTLTPISGHFKYKIQTVSM